MTVKEFYDYLSSFGKKPGEYTKDEVYEIGKKYRELEGRKCWEDLSNDLGWTNGENLRCFVKNRLSKEGKLIPRMTPTQALEFAKANELETKVEDEIDIKMRELYKQQQKYRDIMNSYRRSMRDEARLEAMQTFIVEAMDTLGDLPKITPMTSKEEATRESEAVLLFSDLHIGIECDHFYNKYNKEIAVKRVQMLLDSVNEYCKTFKVKRLNILNLGDCIQGVIHVNARIEQGMDVVSQVIEASEIVAQFLNGLQEAAPQVIYRSCTDNHSRVVADLHQHLEKENLYRLMDWYLQERLKGSAVIFKNDNLDIGLGKFSLLNGKKIMFAHGHQDSINTVFQNWVGATQEYIDYLCIGHYHCEKMKSYQNARVIVNGSIVGTDSYALSKRLFSKPSQVMLVFDEDNTISISINLEDKKNNGSEGR